MTDFIPRQVQWQPELTALDVLAGMDSAPALTELLDMSDEIGQVDSMIANDLALVLRSIDQQSALMLAAVVAERRAILEAVGAERAAVLAAITPERSQALGDIERIVDTSLADVEAASGATVNQLFTWVLFIRR